MSADTADQGLEAVARAILAADDDPPTWEELRPFWQGVALRQAKAAIDALSALLRADWQPIETAPTSGAFQVYAPNEADGRKPYSAGNSNFSVMFRSPNMSLIDAHFHYDMTKPTHWRPLSAPPSEVAEQREVPK